MSDLPSSTILYFGVERTVQISGPDADRLVDTLTCRDLTACVIGQGKYMLVTAPDGGIAQALRQTAD